MTVKPCLLYTSHFPQQHVAQHAAADGRRRTEERGQEHVIRKPGLHADARAGDGEHAQPDGVKDVVDPVSYTHLLDASQKPLFK